jgi:hypothetical protein
VRTCALFFAVLLFGIPLAALDQNGSTKENLTAKYLILPGEELGAGISAATTTQDLIRMYCKENVVETTIQDEIGEDEAVTELFPSDPLRRAVLEWAVPDKRRTLMSVTISGTKSLWTTVHGISLGRTLKELERLNGKPFVLFGFAWDYAGTISSWDGGSLAAELKEVDEAGRVILRLDCKPSQYQQKSFHSVEGDRQFSSSNPAMQQLNPSVYEMIWTF